MGFIYLFIYFTDGAKEFLDVLGSLIKPHVAVFVVAMIRVAPRNW